MFNRVPWDHWLVAAGAALLGRFARKVLTAAPEAITSLAGALPLWELAFHLVLLTLWLGAAFWAAWRFASPASAALSRWLRRLFHEPGQ
jgi:uncharacterized membrane protein YccC